VASLFCFTIARSYKLRAAGFLAGDTSVLVKDKEVLQRIEDISNLSEDKKKYIFDFIDMCLRDDKTQQAYK